MSDNFSVQSANIMKNYNENASEYFKLAPVVEKKMKILVRYGGKF